MLQELHILIILAGGHPTHHPIRHARQLDFGLGWRMEQPLVEMERVYTFKTLVHVELERDRVIGLGEHCEEFLIA